MKSDMASSPTTWGLSFGKMTVTRHLGDGKTLITGWPQHVVLLLWALSAALAASAQTPGVASTSTTSTTPAATTPSAPTPPPAGIAIESAAIAYEAINQLATRIAEKVPSSCEVLLGTSTNLAAVAAWQSFRASAQQMKVAYEQLKQPSLGLSLNPTTEAPLLTALSGALTALKASTTVTGGTFSAVDQAFYADLEGAIGARQSDLVANLYPNDFSAGVNIVAQLMSEVYKARGAALGRVPASPASVVTAMQAAITALDTQLNALQTSITNPSGSVISSALLGAALLHRLQYSDEQLVTGKVPTGSDPPKYQVLIVTDDVAGGGARTNQYFLVNLLVPGPHPSYNGGAVVSYSLRDQDGKYIGAETLRFVYGYTKWKQPPLRTKTNSGYANFDWKGKKDRASWQPIY